MGEDIARATGIHIKKIFDPFFEADLSLWATFAEYIKPRSYKKNEVIKEYDESENYINILISGAVAHFVLASDRDVCINLYFEHQLFSDYLSFLSRSATVIKTCALEDCVIWSVHHDDLQRLYARSNKGLYIGKAIAEAMFVRKQQEQINLLTLSPLDRYVKLLKERPEVLQRVPLKIVCSYLGVTAESLSRIRKKIG